MKINQEQKNAFLALSKKYPYTPEAVGFIFTLANTVKTKRHPSEGYPCVTPEQINDFVDDMLRNNLYFSKKLTKARTASGMKRFMKTLF